MSTAVYIRVSSPKGQKTDSQRAELEAWLKRHHYKSVQWFEDHDSGTTMQREAFQLSLSRLNHWLPRGQTHPEGMQGTTKCHHEIADTCHRRIRSFIMRQCLTLLLTCSIRSRRWWSAWCALCCSRASASRTTGYTP